MSHLKVSIPLKVSRRELATILAALRFHQDENLQGTKEILDQVIREIATDGGFFRPLNYSEVSDLCERINLGPESADGCSCSHQWQSMTLLLPNYSADSGGGIRDFDGTISKSYIYRNEAYNYGGGVYASDATITNTVIYDNTAYYGGGLSHSEGTLENVTIADNIAYYGGGLYDSAEAGITNSIIWSNYLYQMYDTSDTYDPNYSDIQGQETGTGNINSDPKFENVYLFKDYTTADGDPDDDPNYIYVYDASNYAVDDVIEITNDGVARTVIELDTTNDIVYFNPELDEFSRGFISVYNWDDGSDVDEDYRLQTTSMAIDAGNPDSDYSNEPNDGGGRVNMGAYP